METIKYNDLIKDYFLYNAWKSKESFEIENLELSVLNKLKRIELIEFIYEGMKDDRNQESFTVLINKFKMGILDHINSTNKINYLFCIESGSNSISKVRSFKGIIDKKNIDSNYFFQKEFILSNNESRIAFTAQVNHKNFDYLAKFFFDSSNAFIISTHEDYLNERFLDKVCSLFKLEGWTHINLLKVVLEFCFHGDILYRVGGNDGDSYWSLQQFKQH